MISYQCIHTIFISLQNSKSSCFIAYIDCPTDLFVLYYFLLFMTVSETALLCFRIKKRHILSFKFVSKEQEIPVQVSRNGASDTWSISLDVPWEYLLPVLLLHCTLKYTEGRVLQFFVIFRNFSISFTTRKLI